MLTLDLVRITDTYGHVTGEKGRDFDVKILGQVQIPSINPEEGGVANA